MGKSEVIRGLRTRNQLLMYQDQLCDLQDKIEQDQIEVARSIQQNQKICNRNEIVLHSIKQSTISVIKDYKRMEAILDAVLSQKHDLDKIYGVLIGVRNRIDTLEDDFNYTFRITTDEYIEQTNKVDRLN